ncbi:cytidylate kinase [Spirochaetia bacterium]|nr:cytidylate kinase [Spirochaetia bacterium]GHV22125.1 cytidylate kinase [Spirochaetia bacterium]
MIIAIDGPAGSGKSTIANMLAKNLKLSSGKKPVYVNSGNLYRAITAGCINSGIKPENEPDVVDFTHKITLNYDGNTVILNGIDVTGELHTDKVDEFVSPVSSYIPVRHYINDIIREMSKNTDIVVEGRDMTTVVFPNADFRFFLDASSDVRAMRRFKQGVSDQSLQRIKESIEARDKLDKNKPEGSLRIDAGVTYFDTSHLTEWQVYEKLEATISLKGSTMGQMEVEIEEPVGKKSVNTDGVLQTQMQEEYLKSLENLEEGKLINGTVIQVTADQVFLDVGYKSEGKIQISEFTDIPQIGDTVSVILEKKENKYGEVVVSKQKADAAILRTQLKQAFQDHTPITGKIEKVVKGGYDVNLGGDLRAFLPISQSDIQHVEKPEELLGQKIEAFVERIYSDGKMNIVINRRKFLEENCEKKREDFFTNVPVGTEMAGTVKSFTSFGAFVDLGGFDGLLHVNDMSWGHVVRPKDFVKKGQEIKVKVIRIDPAGRRINLSLKHFTDDPWVHFEDKYHVNDIVKGKVTKLADFGAFIEVEEGIEGLAHISEFSWVKKIQNPGDILHIGDQVECMILGYDLQAGRVSLGLKQVTDNPWTDIDKKYPLGTRLTRKIVKVTNAGAFIELEEGIDGFLHSDDLSWAKKSKRTAGELKVDSEIEFIIIGIEPKNRNIRLGVKQLTEDPWQNFAKAYKIGTLIEGEVSSVTDFGIFVKVPGGIEGLIHKTNLVKQKEDNMDDELKKYHAGDKIKAVLIELIPEKQKVAFSIRDYERKVQREEISRYMAAEESDGSTFTLGDMIKSRETPAE